MLSSLFPIFVFALSVVLTGLFAGSETGMYQLSRLRLRLGVEKKQLSYIILDKILADTPGLLIAVLLGTNLSIYVATSIVTYMLLEQTESAHAAEFLATLITAPILFVFSELLPKNLFLYRPDTIMPYTSLFLYSFYKLSNWCGAIPLLKAISKLLARIPGASMPSKIAVSTVQKHEIAAILKDTHEESFLSAVQTDMMDRLIVASNTQIKAVMTPIRKAGLVERSSDKKTLLSILEEYPFTRLPVYDGLPVNIVGFVNIYDVLSSNGDSVNLQSFIKPIIRLSANTTVIDAINVMQAEKHKIALVVRTKYATREGTVGIITMKDLVEELFGELAAW